MDRLSALRVCTLLVGAVGCESQGAPEPPPSRVNAVAVSRPKQAKPEEFCDSWSSAADASSFTLPVLAGDEPPPMRKKKRKVAPPPPAKGPALPATSGWHWVNVWATWCEPCVAEMPMLLAWQKRLRAAGVSLDMVFLSVDEEDGRVAEFLGKHPGIPPGPRVANEDALTAWLPDLGLDASTAIPIHVFVDAAGRRRCVRTGSLLDYHYDVIADLLTSP